MGTKVVFARSGKASPTTAATVSRCGDVSTLLLRFWPARSACAAHWQEFVLP